MTHLVLVDPEITGLSPDQFHDLGACTPEEWEQRLSEIREIAGKARRMEETDARLDLLLRAADAAGLFRGSQVDLSGVLRPYIRKEIIEADQKRGLARAWEKFRSRQRGRILNSVITGAMKLLAKIPALVRK